MTHLLQTGLIFVLWITAASATAVSQAFTHLSFQAGRDSTVSGLRLQLHEPDDPADPTLWQGPLSIAGRTYSCNVSASLIRDVFVSSTGRLAVVVSVSGSQTNIGFFDTRSCASKWPSITVFAGGVYIQRNLLEIHPTCEAAPNGYSCSSASVYRLSDSTAPRRLSAASLALTHQIFGVSFSGSRIIAQPPPSLAPAK